MLLIAVAAFAAICALAACATGVDVSGLTKATFYFNFTGQEENTDKVQSGGVYKNSTNPITYYYDVPEGGSVKILNPKGLDDLFDIQRTDYTLEGWYRTRTENPDGTESFSGKWDFDNDKMDENGVELYARWVHNTNYSYGLYYKDENGEEQLLGKYEHLEPGARFVDFSSYYKKRAGYTMLNYLDEEGNVWDDSFTHPGGETDTEVKVFVDYIEGVYTLVSTPAEFTRAWNSSQGIYLKEDIDLGGGNLVGNKNYSADIMGNGHTVKNFKLVYGSGVGGMVSRDDLTGNDNADFGGGVLFISLFANLSGSKIENITFTDFTIDVQVRLSSDDVKQIIIAPFAALADGAKLTGVKVDCTYTITRLPSGEFSNIEYASGVWYKQKNDSEQTDCELNLNTGDFQ